MSILKRNIKEADEKLPQIGIRFNNKGEKILDIFSPEDIIKLSHFEMRQIIQKCSNNSMYYLAYLDAKIINIMFDPARELVDRSFPFVEEINIYLNNDKHVNEEIYIQINGFKYIKKIKVINPHKKYYSINFKSLASHLNSFSFHMVDLEEFTYDNDSMAHENIQKYIHRPIRRIDIFEESI